MRLTVAVITAALMSTGAEAEDAVSMAGDRWTGFYGGANAGAGFDQSGLSLTTPYFLSYIGPYQASQTTGLIAGVQIGYMHQIGRVVLGLEGDFDAGGPRISKNAGGSVISTYMGMVSSTSTSASSIESQVDWISTLRARVGYTLTDLSIVYVTGGLATARITHDATQAFRGSSYSIVQTYPGFYSTYPGSFYSTNYKYHTEGPSYGWTLGGGVEIALTDRISFRGEYLYVSLGSFDIGQMSYSGTDTDTPAFSMARAAVNYRF